MHVFLRFIKTPFCNFLVKIPERFYRIGVVGVTEASVVIAVSSPHRRDALDAVNFAIEELKARNRSKMIIFVH